MLPASFFPSASEYRIMKNSASALKPRRVSQGFTLVETVIAMGIITIMITAFLAAFAPAVRGIQKSISAKEANRLATTLEHELSVIRYEEESSDGEEYKTSFHKAFEWIQDSGQSNKESIILLYQYRGDPNAEPNDDGSLQALNMPADKDKVIPGEDYVLQSVVRRLNDEEVSTELTPGVVEGRVFYVRMTQLVYDNEVLKLAGANGVPGGPGQIIDPREPRATVTDYNDYPDASIAFQASFYELRSNNYGYINNGFKLDDDNGDGHPDAAGRPTFVRNLAVRR